MDKKDIALKAIMPDPKTGKGGGDLVPEFFELNKKSGQEQLFRSAKRYTCLPQHIIAGLALREQKMLRKGDAPQLERAGLGKLKVALVELESYKKQL